MWRWVLWHDPCVILCVSHPLILADCMLVAAMVGKAAGPVMSAPPSAASCEPEPVTKPGPSGASASGALLLACRTERSPKRVLQVSTHQLAVSSGVCQ